MASVLAIVPARGGSKGVPGKNVRVVAGKPLVSWSIEAASRARSIDAVVVSSDSTEVLQVAASYTDRNVIPIPRPAEYSSDTATTDGVIRHVLDEWASRAYWSPDYVVLLQPTSPVRPKGFVDDVVEKVIASGRPSGFSAAKGHFVWADTEGISDWRCNCDALERRPRRQDMTSKERVLLEDGSVYVTRRASFLLAGARLVRPVLPVLVDRFPEVDTEADVWHVEALLNALRADGRLP